MRFPVRLPAHKASSPRRNRRALQAIVLSTIVAWVSSRFLSDYPAGPLLVGFPRLQLTANLSATNSALSLTATTRNAWIADGPIAVNCNFVGSAGHWVGLIGPICCRHCKRGFGHSAMKSASPGATIGHSACGRRASKPYWEGPPTTPAMAIGDRAESGQRQLPPAADIRPKGL